MDSYRCFLINHALLVYDGLNIIWPNGNIDIKDYLVKLSGLAGFSGCYSLNNGMICFIMDGNNVYITPFTHIIINALKAAGFSEGTFYVPFSECGVYPADSNALTRLNRLRSWAWVRTFYDKQCLS